MDARAGLNFASLRGCRIVSVLLGPDKGMPAVSREPRGVTVGRRYFSGGIRPSPDARSGQSRRAGAAGRRGPRGRRAGSGSAPVRGRTWGEQSERTSKSGGRAVKPVMRTAPAPAGMGRPFFISEKMNH